MAIGKSGSATKVVVATTVMLSFISFWRAAAIVLSDLASSAYYVGGIAETAIEVGGNGVHRSSFCRSRRMPAEAAWRAAVAFDPSAAPMSE